MNRSASMPSAGIRRRRKPARAWRGSAAHRPPGPGRWVYRDTYARSSRSRMPSATRRMMLEQHGRVSSQPATTTQMPSNVLKRLQTALRHPVSRNVDRVTGCRSPASWCPWSRCPTSPGCSSRPARPGHLRPGLRVQLVVFINWGMGPTGTRSTAANRTDADALSEVARGGHCLLTMASAVAVGALVLVLTMRDHPEFLVLAWVAAAAFAPVAQLVLRRPRTLA